MIYIVCCIIWGCELLLVFKLLIWEWICPAKLLQRVYFVLLGFLTYNVFVFFHEVLWQLWKLLGLRKYPHVIDTSVVVICYVHKVIYQLFLVFVAVLDPWWIKPSPLKKGYGIQLPTLVDVFKEASMPHIMWYLYDSMAHPYSLLIFQLNSMPHDLTQQLVPVVNHNFNLGVPDDKLVSDPFLHLGGWFTKLSEIDDDEIVSDVCQQEVSETWDGS